MRISPVSLSGTTLRFDRSGCRLIILEPDEITVVDAAAASAIRLPFRGARAVVGFDDELWIATHDDHLVRIDATGAMLGLPVGLPSASDAVLTPAPCGPPAAVWSAAAPVVCAVDSALGSIPGAAAEAAIDCVEVTGADAVIPITGQRAILARGSRLTLPSGLPVALAPHSRVLGGCVTGDGRWLTLLVAHRAERQLVVVSLGLGQVMHRRSVPPRAALAVAAGIAAVQVEPRALRVIDLTTHRDLGGVSFDHDVAAFAVGPTGRTLATRSPSGELALHRIDPLFPHPFAARGATSASAPRAARGPRAAAASRAPATAVLLAGEALAQAKAVLGEALADSDAVLVGSPRAEDDAVLDEAPTTAAAVLVGSPPADAEAMFVGSSPTNTNAMFAGSSAADADAMFAGSSAADADAMFAGFPPAAPEAAHTDVPAADPPRTMPLAALAMLETMPPLDAPVAAMAAAPPDAAPAVDELLVHRAGAPTARATDWLCGSGDYLEGGA